MKSYCLLLVLFFIRIVSLHAQCPPGDITFTSQQEIADFAANYPGCTVISGNLTVSGADITNVNGIGMLTSVTGNYVFENNTILTNPAGFYTQFTVGGDLRFVNNPALTQTTNFYNYLTSIGGELKVMGNDDLFILNGFGTTTSIGSIHIENNLALTSISGFGDQSISGNVSLINNDSLTSDVPGLNFVGGDLNISENDTLSNLFGLSSLTSVGGNLSISGNEDLPNFFGLGSLASVGGSIIIQYNDSLTALFGLNALDSVGGSFFILNNNSLSNFFGMDMLTSIAGEFRIENNPVITNLAGLGNFTSFGILKIQNNDDLLDLQGLDALTSIGELHIEGNDTLTSLFGAYLLTNVPTVRIYSNPDLTTLNGLDGITTIGALHVIDNASLLNLNGLNGLTSLTNLVLDTNPALVNLFGMNNVNAIPGGILIANNNALPDLSGLGNITSVGNLSLISNDAMTYLNGMSMLATITGNFLVQDNEDLIGIGGLNALDSIGGDLNVNNNAAMTSLVGLNSLATVGGNVMVQNNPLINLNFLLPSLTSIGGSISVVSNNSLNSLYSFNNVTSIGYGIAISGNNSLTNLYGLGNIDHTTIQSLNLQLCPMLFYCQVPSICDYLANGGDGGGISSNAMGCSSEAEVEAACFCPPGNITLSSQAQVDAFATTYPLCTTLPGSLTISGANIANLNGLSGLDAVNGYLNILDCPLLSTLNGLSGLTAINGYLKITNCDLLTSLSGLENIAYTSISHLYLNGSAVLSTCEIPNICTYVLNNLPTTISGNATGCSDASEIQTNCYCISNRLSNPGFDAPIQPSIGNNLTGLFTFNGWTMTGNTFNVIRTDGNPYSTGPDTAQDGTQYVDVAYATGTVYQDFTISGTNIPVFFGGYFSSRTGQSWIASVDIFSMPSNTLVGTSSTYNITAADIETWRYVYGNLTLPAGDYRYVANIDDDGNFDAAFVFAGCTRCTWDESANDWSNPLCWSCGHVPGATDEVRIGGGTVTIPAGFNAVGKTLDVALPAQLEVVPTGILTIQN